MLFWSASCASAAEPRRHPNPHGHVASHASHDAASQSDFHAPLSPEAELLLPVAPDPIALPPQLEGIDLSRQTPEEAAAKSWGCVQCHQGVADMHNAQTVQLGCCDCHGGDSTVVDKLRAHVRPGIPEAWPTSANPVRSYTLLNYERPEFIRFVNPGDLRVAHLSCGTVNCHEEETLAVRKSMMTHGAMLWGAALYNNGAFPLKWPRFGESYSTGGIGQRMQNVPYPTEYETANKGMVPFLDPLPRYEVSQPSNILRIFERGGRFRTEIGIPERLEEAGRPRERISNRGLGTLNRTDPVFVGLAKTRLLDPTLNFLGTNDHPGDYRSSGCTACHVIYANDRSPVHSGRYAVAGHLGMSRSIDPMIPKNEPGHPIEHRFTVGVPTSQCITCHVHPGTNVMNTYLGLMWWDNETDGELMYPPRQVYPSPEAVAQASEFNPEGAAARGLWSNPRFLENVVELNPRARHVQFADFNGHGWIYRAVFKKDRRGNLLDHAGRVVPQPDTGKLMAAMVPPNELERQLGKCRDGVPVHLMDIHLERGMHCVDCHFKQDVHGNTKLYGEVRAAIEIDCIDCHGTPTRRATLRTSGPAAPPGGSNLEALRTPWGKRRFERRGNQIVQNSMVEPGRHWKITQVADTIDPASEDYNEKSHLAKTVRFDGADNLVWGDIPAGQEANCAHHNRKMSCIACHSSWNASCFGCHLPQKANERKTWLHNEGDLTRNYTSYNFQTLRDDVYMLARDGDATGNRIGPCRSACAIHVTSYDQNRQVIYTQQQTISADGMSGIAFSTNVPHTVRGAGETKQCTACHVSAAGDNNAVMAQLLMQGTNFVNWIGRYCWVAAGEHGLEAVVVTELEEPQAVIGSTLHALAYPDYYREHLENDRELEEAHEHPGKDISETILKPLFRPEILQVQLRGEYLYAACGAGGLRVFDVAFIDHKGFSERITTAPVSPFGQRFFVRTQYATAVAAPATIAPDPTRQQRPENRESPIHAMYGNLYVADRYEGLVIVGAATLLDGDPTNNFLERSLTFNPDGILNGARAITIAGTFAYVCCDAGLVVVSLDDPTQPYVTAVLGADVLQHPMAVAVQFRYAFVCDATGMKVLDVTRLENPLPVAALPLPCAKNVYVARTFAYVAAGEHGMIIVDVENPARPRVQQFFDADGEINDLHDIKLGITNNSEFAYLADGENGLRVVQLTSANTPGARGFTPLPAPRLIATRQLPHGGHALFVSKGVDRDRAVDESGNQIAVFGRVGARPLNLPEQRQLYLRHGRLWTVSDDPTAPMYRYLGPP